MHRPGALNNMLAMLGPNKWKQGLFIMKYAIRVNLIPFIRKAAGLAPTQKH